MFDPYEYALNQGVSILSYWKGSEAAGLPQIAVPRNVEPIERRCLATFEIVRWEHPGLSDMETWRRATALLIQVLPREYKALKRKHKKPAVLAESLGVTEDIITIYESMHTDMKENEK